MTQKTQQEGQEIFDLTKEEVAWLEEHFIDFAREQYLVRWDDMRETLKIAQRQKELQRQDKCGNRTRIVKLIKMAKIGKWRADRAQITLP